MCIRDSSKLGGFDIAGLCGVFLGGALEGLPVLMDGFISGVAALCAVRLCPCLLYTSPCLYGAIREQMDALDADGIPYDDTPGVSSFCGAAAALNAEYTLPTISQTVIITRMEGRTPVPEKEQLASLAAHGATMVIFLLSLIHI